MRIWIGIGIFLGVLIIAFIIFAAKLTEKPAPQTATTTPDLASITDVSVSDSYSSKTGAHTITGTATVPTACTTLTATSTVLAGAAASSSVIRIDLSAAADNGICLELPTPIDYSIHAVASKDASIEVYANGTLATSTP